MALQARVVASSESAVGGGQPVYDIRSMRDHHEQRPVDIAEAINCPPLAAMLSPSLSLNLATAGTGYQVPHTALWCASHDASVGFDSLKPIVMGCASCALLNLN